MDTLLSRSASVDVKSDPFPYLVVRNALDDDLVDELLESFPPLETISYGQDLGSNKRFSLKARDAMQGDASAVWKEFTALHTSQLFLDELMRVFAPHIEAIYPSFAERVGDPAALRAGIREVDDYGDADVLLDAQPSINSPVIDTPTAVRRAHLDKPETLLAGLYYLRHPEDESTGSDLEIYRFKGNRPHGLNGRAVNDHLVEVVDTVRYERNTLVLFLNSIKSLHGVTVRSQTPVPRYFVNLLVEVAQPMWNTAPYQQTFKDKLAVAPYKAIDALRRRQPVTG
jgi:uncharacterized protein YheU (UPF0270 family)